MAEWQARGRLLNPKPKAEGWEVTRFRDSVPPDAYEEHAVEEFPTDNRARWLRTLRWATTLQPPPGQILAYG